MSVFLCVFRSTWCRPIKWSPLALNLPAFLPQALETVKGTTLYVLIQRNPSISFSLPMSPVSVLTHLSLKSKVRYYWGPFFLPPVSCITVTATQDIAVWLYCSVFFRVYWSSCICDLFFHFHVPQLKQKHYLFRKYNGGRNNTSIQGWGINWL